MGNLVFLDVETTGLDPEVDVIIEVGVVIVDPKQIFNATDGVIFQGWWTIAPPEDFDYSHIDQKVLDMHTENRLWDIIPEGIPYNLAEEEIYEFLGEAMFVCGASESPMCGNTISFDRAFLQKHLPSVEKLFHYRNIDVSTFNVTAEYFPELLDQAKKESNHRALDDCRQSIRQYKHYLEQIYHLREEMRTS